MKSQHTQVPRSENLSRILAATPRLASRIQKLFLAPLALFVMLLIIGANQAQAAPTVVGVSETNIATGPETLTITKPAGVQVGDLMIVNLNTRGDNTAPSTVPAGWVQRLTYAHATAGRYVWIGYKVAVAADLTTANYSFTYSGNNDDMAGGITAFRGVDVASANGGIQVTGAPYVAQDGNPLAPASITTLSANSLVVFLGQVQTINFNTSNWLLGGSSGAVMTQLYQVNPTSICGVGAAALPKVAAGATGSGYKLTGADRKAGVLLALKEGCNTTIGGASSACVGATAVVTPTSGGTWTSSNTAIATVTNAGVVTGVSPGVVTLSYVETATGNFCSKPFTVNGVTIGGATSVAVGFQANVTPSSGGTWTSSNTGVATITSAGVVTGVSTGQTTLTYTANGCSNAVTFSVYTLSNPVKSTLTSNRDTDLYAGEGGNENFGSCNYMTAGGKGGKDEQRDRSIVGFDLASIPSGSVITSAVLRLTNVNILEFEATARDVSVHRLTSDWVEGTGACYPNGTSNTNATWLNNSTGSPWTTEGGDFVATPLSTISVGGVGSYDWPVTSQLQSWLSGTTPNYGFLVKYVDETVSSLYKNFATREFATATSRPQLLLTYQVPCLSTLGGAVSTCVGTPANVTVIPAAAGTWSSSNTSIATVTSAGVVTGLSGGTVTLTFTDTSTGCVYTKPFTVIARPTLGGATTVCQGSTANVTPATGGTWSSSNNSIATVSNAGVVNGLAAGTVTLTFTNTSTGCTNTRSLTVNALPTLGGLSAVCIGSAINVTPSTGGTWSTADGTIATVTPGGLVSGVAAGNVTLTFTTSAGCSNTKKVTVNALPILGGATSVCLGSTTNVTPTSGGTWSSSSNSIATVSNAGLVTGVSPGVVNLTFTSTTTGCANTRSFTVYSPPTLSGATTGCIGTPSNVFPSSGGSWSSSTPAIASVSNSGVITNTAIGTVTLTFTDTATGCSNTLSYKVNALPVLGGASVICAGSTSNVTPSTGGTWSSSNSGVASVTNAGVVTGISGGTATLTFTSTATGCAASKLFSVNPSPALGGSSSVELGATANVTPASGGTWSSSDSNIASIDNAGEVTGNALGEVTLTFTDTATGCVATKPFTVLPVANYLNSSMIDSLDQIDPTPEDHIETEPVFPTSTSSLIVSVFMDNTGDGLGDVPLSGIVITLLDSNNNVVATVNTAVNGLYTFPDLPPGLYTVVQTVPNGTYTLYDNPLQVTVVLGETATADFVNSESGSISGTVYANNGDDVLAGVIISLLDGSGQPVLDDNNLPITTVTDINGFYVFNNVPVGNYQVQQTVPSGFTAVDDVDGGILTLNGDITPIVITPGLVVTNQDFTNSEPGSISGTVTIDTTLDLAGDIPHVGVTVALLDVNGDPVLDGSNVPITTVTDSNGAYSFTNLTPGTYQVAQVVPSGYTAVSDSDGLDFTIVGDVTPLIIIEGSTAVANFTNQQQADIEITKIASNMTPNVGDEVTFTIVIKNNGPSATVVNNVAVEDIGTGLIYVSDTPSKGTFTIDPGAPTNSYSGIWDVGTLALNEIATLEVVATVSTAPGITSFCNSVTASSSLGDQNLLNNEATVCVNPVRRSISGTVLIDTTGDTNGNIAHQSVTVALLDGSGNPVLDLSNNPVTTTTNSLGQYTFADLSPGDYQVRQTVPATFIAVNDIDGNDLSIIGDVTLITLTNSADIIDQDFVNTQLGSIAGNVSRDNTGDNVGDVILPGVLVVLRDSAGNFLLDSNNDLIVVATNGLGNYIFTNVPPGNYQVSVVPPLGLVAVDDVDGGDLYFNGDQTLIAVAPAQAVTGQDFVLSQLVDVIAVKGVNNSTPLVGSVVTFTVNITNAGPATATGVVANDLLPNGYTLNSSNASQGSYNEFTGVWTIGNLALGANAQLTMTATVLATGNYNNVVTVTSNEIDINLSNNTDNEEPIPNNSVDVQVVKSVSSPTTNGCSSVTFTMVVTNNGSVTATGTTLTDLLPSGYTYVSDTTTISTYDSGTGEWVIGTLAGGVSQTLTITATVNPSGNYLNSAEVTVNETDTNLANNTSTASTVLDLDSDDDGIPDCLEISNVCPSRNGDTDGDGVPDQFDLDSDGDGIFDVVEAGNGDLDPDKNGRIDSTQGTNGLADIVETAADSGIINYTLVNSDLDDRPDYLDLDSDNDSISDVLESGNLALSDIPVNVPLIGIIPDGIADGTVNVDGIVTGAGATPVSSDGDSLPDYIDVDSDGDGVFDIVNNGYGSLDAIADGMIDNVSSPNDCDGIADVLDPRDDVYGWFPVMGCVAWSLDAALDIDGDVFPADQEYAFGGDPELGDHLVAGTTRRAGMAIAKNGTVGVPGGAPGGVDISFVRPRGRYDVTYTLYVSDDPRIAGKWTAVTTLPVITDNGDGTETLKWINVHDIDGNALVTRDRGFARLKVETPCSTAESWTLVQGWQRQDVVGKYQTYGVNFSSMPVFTGIVDAADLSAIFTVSKGQDLGNYLKLGSSYYLEITDGLNQGHRFDIASGDIESFVLDLTSLNNTINTLPTGLVNSHFVVRKHDTIGGIYSNPEWVNSVATGSADQVLIYNGTGYDTYFNLTLGSVWAKQGDGFGSKNSTIVAPGTGMMVVHAFPNGDNELLAVGDLRYNDFRRPLKLGSSGLNFVAMGYPFSESPGSLNMTVDNGFFAAVTPGSSTQILNWTGDTTVNSTGWTTNFQLFNAQWRTQGDLSVSTTNSLLFRYSRGTQVDVQADKLDWKHIRPWDPSPWVQPGL